MALRQFPPACRNCCKIAATLEVVSHSHHKTWNTSVTEAYEAFAREVPLIGVETLFFKGIAVDVIAVLLPEPGDFMRDKFYSPHPLH